MYLTEPRLFDVVKKQLHYKFNGYTGVFTSLLIVQVIAILLGIGTMGNHSSFGESVTVIGMTSTNDNVVLFTLIWAFITGILVTTTAYRNDAFTLVSNRLSHHLSSSLFLLIVATLAGITAALSGSLLKFIVFFQGAAIYIETPGLLNSPTDFLYRIGTAILYVLLFISLGYLVGSFVQKSKIIIPLLLLGLFTVPFLGLQAQSNHSTDSSGLFENLIFFYGAESNFLVLGLKVVCTVALFFTISSVALMNREVRSR
ncbi:hypothetical protein ACXYMX_03145 [Sporosarcina sp. CAU 1771]